MEYNHEIGPAWSIGSIVYYTFRDIIIHNKAVYKTAFS
jgi:hypothetical protein